MGKTMKLVALIGKGGSVFKAAMKELADEIELYSIIVYNDRFKPDTEEMIRKTYCIPMDAFFFETLNNFLKPVKNKIFVFSWFDRVIPGWFLKEGYEIYNQHPSLLPAFKGLNAWEQALKANVKVTGTTIHRVAEEVDSGEIVTQDPLRIDGQYPHENRQLLFELQVRQFVDFARGMK